MRVILEIKGWKKEVFIDKISFQRGYVQVDFILPLPYLIMPEHLRPQIFGVPTVLFKNSGLYDAIHDCPIFSAE